MPEYYIYLISSLPMLHFTMKPPFSFEVFLEICRGKISEENFNILTRAAIDGEYTAEDEQISALKNWHRFDTALRNEIVRIRSARGHVDGLKYLRGEEGAEPFMARIAITAYRSPSILGTERMLDEARWHALDEAALGHYFDMDFLVVYAHKLLILERWERIRGADSRQLLEKALA